MIVAPGRRNGHSYRETQAVAARALTEVFERTTQLDVKVAVEPIVEWQSDYLNTLGEALELVELSTIRTSASIPTRSTSGGLGRCSRTSSAPAIASSAST